MHFTGVVGGRHGPLITHQWLGHGAGQAGVGHTPRSCRLVGQPDMGRD